MNEKNSRLITIFLIYDSCLIVASFLGSICLKYGSLNAGGYYILLPALIVIWTGIILGFKSQSFYFRESLLQHLQSQILDFLFFTGTLSTLVLILDLQLYSRLVLFGTILFFFTLRNLGFYVLHRYLSYMRVKGRHVKRLLIVGAGRIGKQLEEKIRRNVALGYKVVGFLDDGPGDPALEGRIIGGIGNIDSIIESQRVEEIILAIPLTATESIRSVIEAADYHGIRTSMVPDYYRLVQRSFETRTLGDMPLVSIREVTLDKLINKGLKRLFDMLFSFAVLVLLFPVFLFISVAIKATSKGPVFYRPIRVGLGGNDFECLKFRSMIVDDSPDHHLKSTEKDDPRITRVGAFLRRNSLDELPQFINVLRGDMSVVGPRPHRKALNADMQNEVTGYMLRHYVKPGITGWAQVNGWRGPTETQEQREQRTLHDLWYIENWSLWLDIRIVLMTLVGRSKQNAF